MPAQTNQAEIKFYQQFDTGPPLEETLYTDQSRDTPIDLTDVANVYITIAHTQLSHYYYRALLLVDHFLCSIEGDPTEGNVKWVPQSLSVPGMFDYFYTLVYNDSSQATSKSYTYRHMRVQAPAGGRVSEPWTP